MSNKNIDTVRDPAVTAYAVTPSDTDLLPLAARALYCGTGGDITLMPFNGTDPVTFIGVVAGSILPVQCTMVMATDTDAEDIVALV